MMEYVETHEIMPGELLDVLADVRSDIHGLGLNLRTLADYKHDDDLLGLLSDVAFSAYHALEQCEPMVAALMTGGDAR